MDPTTLGDEIVRLLREAPYCSLSFRDGARLLGVSERVFVDAARRAEDRGLAVTTMNTVYLLRGTLRV
jgi:hypothetical protein